MNISLRRYGPCVVRVLHYRNGRPAVQIDHAETGEPIVIPSANVPCVPLAADEFLVPIYRLDAWILEDLRRCGRFINTGRQLRHNFGAFEVWQLVDPGKAGA